MIKNYLTETYDKTAEYDAEVKPLIDQIFDICAKHQIPFAFYACAKSTSGEDGNHTMVGSLRMEGPARTPFELLAISAIINEAGSPSDVATACAKAGAMIVGYCLDGEVPAGDEQPADASVH